MSNLDNSRNNLLTKKRKRLFKKGLLFFLSFCFIYININFISVNFARASWYTSLFGDDWSGEVGGGKPSTMEIFTNDMEARFNTLKSWLATVQGFVDEADRWLNKQYGARIYKAALHYFLNTLAHDTAVYLASGDEGQKPMFITDSWGKYLSNIADDAAGLIIEDLGKQGAYGMKFNLCEPDFAVKLKINLGLVQSVKPNKPACTFSTMIKNWDQELKNPDFLPKFQDMFNPYSNDLGIALTVQTGMEREISKKINEATQERIANKGWLSVKEPISGNEKTPASLVQKSGEKAVDDSTAAEKIYTENYVADAINIFINTLAGKFFDQLLKKGLVTSFPEHKSWDYSKNAQGQNSKTGGGLADAKERFKSLTEPSFSVRGDYNILSELTMCPDPTKAGPTNCVITENFRQAIENRMTVGQAMKEGYLNKNGIFGFTSNSMEPSYNEGYPYRSMLILRKFRIIPVGWEIASQYINDFGAKTYNLGDLVACYDVGDEYEGLSEDWCKNLVDPNWVLKAPLNYCKREGHGPELLSEQVMGEGDSSQRIVARNDNYCADEQSCIKENDDGSCQLYGYCTEERRKWQFNGQSCEPKYNTCQTFKSEQGNTISYLENSLNYSGCSIDNVGCKAYCVDYDFGSDKWNCATASANDKIYLDNGAEECDSDNEGCHEFIRTKAGSSANLLINSSFEEYAGTVDDGIADDFNQWGAAGEAISSGYSGLAALKLSANLNKTVDIALAGYSAAGEAFTLSFYAKDCAAGDTFKIEDQDAQDLSDSAEWQYYKTTYVFPLTAFGYQVDFSIHTGSCAIDSIKLERGTEALAYSDYREAGLIYEKLAPAYLGCDGAGDPSECADFARACSAEEVGCDMYTSQTDETALPAKTAFQDYCPSECAGYDAYIQSETVFDSLRDSYFIPSSAKKCGAAAVGCDQFTNLDEVAKGGEGIEYYSYLRQCIKETDPAADCGEFYTWEGSEETGFQLKVHKLQQNAGEPAITEDDSLECDAAVYALSPLDPAYNSDCREFYNKNGDIYYHLYSRTISCNNDCHPYRRTEKNIDPKLDALTCSAAGSGYANTANDQFHWDADLNLCYFCKNGGKWNVESGACVYMAVPAEGTVCSAGNNGCREYKGNAGNNLRIIVNYDFEGSLMDWTGLNGTTAALNNEALFAGGNSLSVSGGDYTAAVKIGSIVFKNKSYIISFIAKSGGASKINSIKLVNGTGGEADFGSTALGGNWRLYKMNLAELDHIVDENESLVINGNGDYYIDDIRLTEITERYYLIKGSWQTPESCYYDTAYNYVGPYYNAGCELYLDRDNKEHYLHQFSRLCSDTAVGCEVMIDTHNSTAYSAETFNAGDLSEITVLADNYIYAVYDKEKQCAMEEKGCGLLGLPYIYGDEAVYSNAYLKNNPDQYGSILCGSSAIGCEEWTSGGGTAYFKDPQDQVCEWRQKQGEASGWAWYKKRVKRCDTDSDGIGDGAVCLENGNCASGACAAENTDLSCPASNIKTFGYGGAGNQVIQPNADGGGNFWAGVCPAAQSGCGEYIEPISRFSNNLLFNGDFAQDTDNNGVADGWSAVANGEQLAGLSAYTLYILAVDGNNTATLSASDDVFYELGNNNYLVGPLNQITATSAGAGRASKRFYTIADVQATISVASAAAGNNSKAVLNKAVVDYQLKQDLDKTACNGIVDFEQGCVLFNERVQNGSSLAGLTWDADLTYQDGVGTVPNAGAAGERDANVLLKVSPNRVCDKWLACRSYIKDENNNNVCFDIGLCNGVDDNGNCNSFIINKEINQAYPAKIDSSAISDMSGYAKAGYDSGASKSSISTDYYPFDQMKQVGQAANVSNGGFEFYSSSGYPFGWNYESGAWSANVFSAVNSPYAAQSEGIGYAPEGNGFIKIGAVYSAVSEYISVAGGIDYTLTVYTNAKNLSAGTAVLEAREYDGSGSPVAGAVHSVSLNAGRDWTYQLLSFTTNANTSSIKIKLYAAGGTTGNIYFDDIKIRPALASKDNWKTAQSCRLYPASDSLSCDYYDDSWIRQKGWYGYCLEYDRYPGSKDACLLWLPADKVKGEGIEEGAGYEGKAPVYYCLEGTTFQLLEYRSNPGLLDCTGEGDDWSPLVCPSGYTRETVSGEAWGYHWCKPAGACISDCVSNDRFDEDSHGWYLYNGFHTVPQIPGDNGSCGDINNSYSEVSKGVKYVNTVTGEVVDDLPGYCSKLVMTVNNVGENKYWAGRVYEGSDYKVLPLNLGYTADNTPFGSLAALSPSNNPYEWDGDSSAAGKQPIYFNNNNVLGRPYSIVNNIPVGFLGVCNSSGELCYSIPGLNNTLNKAECESGDSCVAINFAGNPVNESLRHIFAQSYGSWQWDGEKYAPTNIGWNVPTASCGGARPAYPGDFCGVLPAISNIKANSQTGDFAIIGSLFVNITFNTFVDSEQLPLVMYSLNWGDNESTTVSGVEMRDRPQADNPHSLYHLYSYWDLRSKWATNQAENTVYCGDAGALARNYDGANSGYTCPAGSGCCVVKPGVKIQDNWNWCNNGADGTPCPAGGYKNYEGWIVVKEK